MLLKKNIYGSYFICTSTAPLQLMNLEYYSNTPHLNLPCHFHLSFSSTFVMLDIIV